MTDAQVRAALIALWLAGLVVFALMAVLAAAHDTFPMDVWLTERLQSVHSEALSQTLNTTSDLAVMPWLALVAGVAVVGYLVRGGPMPPLLLVAAVTSRVVVGILKEVVERPRPSPSLVDVEHQLSSLSFPSGHSFNAMLIYGLIFYFATVLVRPPASRRAIQAACVWVIVLTGVQRVYFGYHWTSDVLGGFLLGAVFVGVFVGLHRLSLRSPMLQRRLRGGSFAFSLAPASPGVSHTRSEHQ
ncbi:MAG: phosphatase PAP2 family protein [Dehalococcoidia bacterium]